NYSLEYLLISIGVSLSNRRVLLLVDEAFLVEASVTVVLGSSV
ncbi:17404_t:CDS:1, partial [Dentiscutata heterogama]